MQYEHEFELWKEKTLHGRYISLQHIEPVLAKYQDQLEIVGKSVLDKPIYQIKIGRGSLRILIWSQMHGNESTTTKALFDFLNFLSDSEQGESFLKAFTFLIIPILNPDGAELYTRENAVKVDLNRDFLNLTQPESRCLMNIFNDFKPDFCFNMHDQRTIFGVETTNLPATVSFLAPSFNEDRSMNETRERAAQVIASMNKTLQKYIPGQVSRFDDIFNRNCVGDAFQSLGVATILFEAGHFPEDYDREITRKFIFLAILSGLEHIYENDIVMESFADYLIIPQNKVSFYDIVYKNVKINYDGKEFYTNFATQYKEVLIADSINFNGIIVETKIEENYSGHKEYDAEGQLFKSSNSNFPKVGEKADFYIGDLKFINGRLDSEDNFA